MNGQLTVADVLAFEAWPEEMQRIARAALADEADEAKHQHLEAVIDEARDIQYEDDQAQFVLVHQHLDNVKKKLHEAKGAAVMGTDSEVADAALVEAIRLLENIPDELVRVEEPDE